MPTNLQQRRAIRIIPVPHRLKSSEAKPVLPLDPPHFRRALHHWYKHAARPLPWRNIADPYRTWVSEVMLQQTRVNAVIDHYHRFLAKFPTILALALAPEPEVLAAWSGLGYYRRARMLHKAAQFITKELNGILPPTSTQLRELPGIGTYTSAAIASIAFGESIAVLDGNVERTLLRITGQPQQKTAAASAFLHATAQSLVPHRRFVPAKKQNAAGDHNQAMMELGATLCLPRAPLCLACPVFDFCRTRGEHLTAPATKMRSREVAYLLALRKRGTTTEVLLHHRPAAASLMPNMYELPELPLTAIKKNKSILSLRHSITNTNYYVQVFPTTRTLRRTLPHAPETLTWHRTSRLAELPLTGLARKSLQRLTVMQVAPLQIP